MNGLKDTLRTLARLHLQRGGAPAEERPVITAQIKELEKFLNAQGMDKQTVDVLMQEELRAMQHEDPELSRANLSFEEIQAKRVEEAKSSHGMTAVMLTAKCIRALEDLCKRARWAAGNRGTDGAFLVMLGAMSCEMEFEPETEMVKLVRKSLASTKGLYTEMNAKALCEQVSILAESQQLPTPMVIDGATAFMREAKSVVELVDIMQKNITTAADGSGALMALALEMQNAADELRVSVIATEEATRLTK